MHPLSEPSTSVDVVQEGMEDWDQEQLEKVINDKHGNERPSNTTEIICKFFIDAVEKRMYGWCALDPGPERPRQPRQPRDRTLALSNPNLRSPGPEPWP